MTLDTNFNHDQSFDDLALDAIETLDSFALGTVSLMKADERAQKTQGFGATMGAQAIVKRYLEETVVSVKAHHAASLVGRQGDGVKDLMEAISTMEPELVSLVALQVGLETVANGQVLSKAYFALGKAVENEVWAHALKTQDKKLAARIEKLGKKRTGLSARRTAVRKIAAANDFTKAAWTRIQQTTAGKWMVEVLLMGTAFVRVDTDEDGNTVDAYLNRAGFPGGHLVWVRLPRLAPRFVHSSALPLRREARCRSVRAADGD